MEPPRHHGDRNGFCWSIKGFHQTGTLYTAKPAVPAHAVDGTSRAILGDGEQNCEAQSMESQPKQTARQRGRLPLLSPGG